MELLSGPSILNSNIGLFRLKDFPNSSQPEYPFSKPIDFMNQRNLFRVG